MESDAVSGQIELELSWNLSTLLVYEATTHPPISTHIEVENRNQKDMMKGIDQNPKDLLILSGERWKFPPKFRKKTRMQLPVLFNIIL